MIVLGCFIKGAGFFLLGILGILAYLGLFVGIGRFIDIKIAKREKYDLLWTVIIPMVMLFVGIAVFAGLNECGIIE